MLWYRDDGIARRGAEMSERVEWNHIAWEYPHFGAGNSAVFLLPSDQFWPKYELAV